MTGAATPSLPRPGLYVRWRGGEYPLSNDERGRAVIWVVADEAPGAEWIRDGSSFVLPVSADDVDDVWTLGYRGRYRGVDVQVSPARAGTVWITTIDVPEGVAVGMTQDDRAFASANVSQHDPELEFDAVRSPGVFPG